VRAGAGVKLVRPKPLRGTLKLAHALAAFGLDVSGSVAVDIGAAAGGFTQALLDAGAARVYAVDAGVGQLRGWLRTDPRVVNLEHTNLALLDRHLVPEPVDVVVMDLSYLSIADAIPQLDQLDLAPGAELVSLVKPTFELHQGRLAAGPGQVTQAVSKAGEALEGAGWDPAGQVASPVPGSRGAVEVLLLARRRPQG
jgi:23S rRNA (cytidine1920-2'-O)/16S rRNA (cytidine1409-2'-O)-methyltransferase